MKLISNELTDVYIPTSDVSHLVQTILMMSDHRYKKFYLLSRPFHVALFIFSSTISWLSQGWPRTWPPVSQQPHIARHC